MLKKGGENGENIAPGKWTNYAFSGNAGQR